jgi:hypothetical protein
VCVCVCVCVCSFYIYLKVCTPRNCICEIFSTSNNTLYSIVENFSFAFQCQWISLPRSICTLFFLTSMHFMLCIMNRGIHEIDSAMNGASKKVKLQQCSMILYIASPIIAVVHTHSNTQTYKHTSYNILE